MQATLAFVAALAVGGLEQPADDGRTAPESPTRLELTCIGNGSANKLDVIEADASGTQSGMAFGSDGSSATYSGSSSGSATAYVPRTQAFADQMDLYIEGSEGRVRVPRVMLPIVRGGENGWFKIKNLRVEENEITASVAINVINNPKLRVDRRTGVVNLSGKAGDFVGRCRKIDPATAERQF